MRSHYFDYNATTPVLPEVLKAMEPYWQEHFGNASSIHQEGRFPAKAIKQARIHVATLLGSTDEKEIVFTSGGTESNNTAIRSALRTGTSKDEIVLSSVEHSSIRNLCLQLQKEGYTVKQVPVHRDGSLDFENLKSSVTEKTAIVSIMMANNETGVIFPVREIGEWLREKGVLFHVDAVQAAGKMPVDVKTTPLDFLSLSGHKIYGPKGIGALYVRKGLDFCSLIYGGSQERGRRAGTENIPGIAGLSEACRIAAESMPKESKRLTEIRDLFEKEIVCRIKNCDVHGAKCERLPNTSNIFFKHTDGEALLLALDQAGIIASSGSACMSSSREPSHVIKAMGYSDEDADSSIRFSFGRKTSLADIPEAVSVLTQVVAKVREFCAKMENSKR